MPWGTLTKCPAWLSQVSSSAMFPDFPDSHTGVCWGWLRNHNRRATGRAIRRARTLRLAAETCVRLEISNYDVAAGYPAPSSVAVSRLQESTNNACFRRVLAASALPKPSAVARSGRTSDCQILTLPLVAQPCTSIARYTTYNPPTPHFVIRILCPGSKRQTFLNGPVSASLFNCMRPGRSACILSVANTSLVHKQGLPDSFRALADRCPIAQHLCS